MPPPRKPTGVLELSGAFEKDPKRRRPPSPKSAEPIGDPLARLAPDEAACWREFCRDAPAGMLTSGDRWALEALARLMAKSRREGLTGAETGHLRGFLTELGASPASRGRCSRRGLPSRPPAIRGTCCRFEHPFNRPDEHPVERLDGPRLFCATQGRTTTHSNARLTGTAIQPDKRRWPRGG